MFRVCRNYGSVLRVPTVPAPSPRHWKRLCASRQLHSWLRRRLSGCGVERENDALVATGVVCGRATRCAGRRAGVRPVSSAAAVSTTGTDEFTVSSNVGGSEIHFSSGKVALLADGAVVVQSGNTCVLVTAVSSKHPSLSAHGTPLQVEYRERAAAAGRIPHNSLKREMRMSEREVLVCRFIDRSIRPLFPEGFSCETQVICSMLAVDGRHDPEVMALNGAAAALCLSDIPWNGPVAAVRVGLIDGKLCLNPTMKELGSSTLDLIVASTESDIVMVEGLAHEVPEDTFCEAVLFAHQEAQPLLATLSELKKERGKPPRPVNLHLPSPELQEFLSRDGIRSILTDSTHKKMSRDNALKDLMASASQKLSLQRRAKPSLSSRISSSLWSLCGQRLQTALRHLMPSISEKLSLQRTAKPSLSRPHFSLINSSFWSLCAQELQTLALDSGLRCDGRGLDDLRPISCEVDLLPTLHGSSLFKRGETQVFCTVTFDSPEAAAPTIPGSGSQKYKRFMIQYEFPPFSINTIGGFLTHGRREIGHGALAEKAFLPVLPAQFPFTTRVTSQVLDSNGSSSMATVSGASLALYDAGVPLSRPVAGVSCGLVTRQDPETGELLDYKILTDISGIEDAQGNMDFKVAGTSEGITSLQLDVKSIPGIPCHVFEEAIMKSREARLRVLEVMRQCQATPRPELKENGPAYASIEVPPEKRRKLIGSGGHRIRALMAETGADVRSVSDEQMSVFAPTREAMEDVMERMETILQEEEEKEEFEVGAIYPAVVKDVRVYGLIVELAPGVTLLLHKSQLSHKMIFHPSELGLEVGQTINVKYYGRDPITQRHTISRKALLSPPQDTGREAVVQTITTEK